MLTEKGIPSELLIFEDEGHTVEKLPNRIEMFTRMTEFLGRVLGGNAATMGAAKAPWPSG